MFWWLVRLSTGALSGGLYANPLEMAIQSAVACSEAKDDGQLFIVWGRCSQGSVRASQVVKGFKVSVVGAKQSLVSFCIVEANCPHVSGAPGVHRYPIWSGEPRVHRYIVLQKPCHHRCPVLT